MRKEMKMKWHSRLGAILALGAIAFTGAVSNSAAGVPQGTTDVRFDGTVTDQSNGFLLFYGRVLAQPQQCAKNRPIQLEFDRGSGVELIDSGLTSGRGYYALAGPVTGTVNFARIVTPKSTVKVGQKKVTCQRATEVIQG